MTAKKAPSKRGAKAAAKRTTRPPARGAPPPPRAGPGRPRKPRPPRDDQQLDLAGEIKIAEAERDAAAGAYNTDASVAAEIRLLRAELSVSSAWSAYCRAQGNHAPALKYTEQTSKLAARIAVLRELAAADQLEALLKRAGREDALRGERRAKAGR